MPWPHPGASPGVLGKRSGMQVARIIVLLRYCSPSVSLVVQCVALDLGVVEATVPLVIVIEL